MAASPASSSSLLRSTLLSSSSTASSSSKRSLLRLSQSFSSSSSTSSPSSPSSPSPSPSSYLSSRSPLSSTQRQRPCLHASSGYVQRRPNSLPFQQTSNLHTLPPLPEILSEGCRPFLSQKTVQLIGQHWQGGLLKELNKEVKDTEYASSSIVETVIGLSQDRERILAFNYASQALNNSFFLSSLAPQKKIRSPTPTRALGEAVNKSFESYPALCYTFSSAAMGMSGSGWVWLVTDQEGRLGVVPTFGAGTVVVQSRQQRGLNFLLPSVNDAPTTNKKGGPSAAAPAATESNPSSSTSFRSSATSIFNSMLGSGTVGKELYPLLCVSVHEHAWLPDYGIMGKEEYLMNFWEAVNWDKVSERYEAYSHGRFV
ncbi:manganese and iron superoxide dismutase [Violaceomyces palustris]|uniref:Manganese and iron superoxide dismutase n=1 Tax=Violaceomyces palustris TaxID=1673888 RepID=A0ACD0NWM9_9BASI|nr:manganese and iron superoxide dismutase [Violaceomyces palustris]